jgi:hypothetical protein
VRAAEAAWPGVVLQGCSNEVGASHHSGARRWLAFASSQVSADLQDCMVPIHPASAMPMADPTIAHKRLASLCRAIDAKHPVLD